MHPSSFAATMQDVLFAQADFAPGRTHLPDGAAADWVAEAARYETAIRDAGGIGLQLLGIGRTGTSASMSPAACYQEH